MCLSGPDRRWPQSTRRIAELRLTIEFERAASWGVRSTSLRLDIVDYPGEWLLDLPLLDKTYAAMVARDGLPRARPRRARRSRPNGAPRSPASTPKPPPTRTRARRGAELFTDYLARARDDVYALSTLPPGRFLMPGNLEGSPALTFAPLALGEDATIASGSLWAMMARRYEAYKAHVVRPFFRDHFARLDRQIVLVDALAAFNSGPAALRDLELRWPGSCAPSASAAPRCSPRSSARASTASCSPRPRPIICIIRATIGSRRSCGALTRRRSRAPKGSAPRSTSSRSPRSAPRARLRSGSGRETLRCDHRRAGKRRDDRRRDVRRRRGSRRVSRRIAGRPGSAVRGRRDRACPRPTTTGGSCASARR